MPLYVTSDRDRLYGAKLSPGLGQSSDVSIGGIEFNPLLLGLGILALFGAMYVFGSGSQQRKKRSIQRRISRTRSKLAQQQAQLAAV